MKRLRGTTASKVRTIRGNDGCILEHPIFKLSYFPWEKYMALATYIKQKPGQK
jgi:hypothetical protein